MNYLQFKCKEKKHFSYHPLMGAILLTSVLLVLLVGTSEALAAELPAPSIYLPVTIQRTNIVVSSTQSNTTEITATQTPILTVTPSPTGTVQTDCDLNSAHISDLTIQDGDEVIGGQEFEKIWRVRNIGSCTWDEEYSLVFITGTIGMDTSMPISLTAPGEDLDISLSIFAPSITGTFTGVWQLKNAEGEAFGETEVIEVKVSEIAPTPTSTSTPIPTSTSTPTPTSTNTPTATATATPIIETATAEVQPTNIIETATAEVQPTNIIETAVVDTPPTASPTPLAPTDSTDPTDPTDPTDLISLVLEQFSNPNPLVLTGIGGVLLLIVLIFAFLFGRGRGPDEPEAPAPTSSGPPPTGPSGLNGNGVQVPPVMAPPPLGTPYLESLARPAGKVYYPLTQSVIMLGRDQNDHLTIDESFVGWHTVSRKHAKLEREGSNMILVDLNSENGVYVNDLPTGENLLANDCAIMLGQVQFAFRLNQGGVST